MPEKKLKNFEVKRVEVLKEDGSVDSKLMPKLSDDDIKKMYEAMILTRVFDDKCIKLQRQGRCGTYASSLGQEATVIGSSYAVSKDDWLVPNFRENGAFLLKGYPIDLLLQYWKGDERGSRCPSNLNILPISIPVGTQLLHAVGIGFAIKFKKENKAVLTYVGDGGTSEGDFHEALNLAGVFKIPVVFVIQNNQYAISVPRRKQTSALTLAQKAISYGFNGVQVDGNDIFAVYKTVNEAVENARNNNGPTLIECETYRIENHTTSDDWTKYRTKEEVEEWKKKEPVLRLEKYMKSKNLLDDKYKNRVLKDAQNEVEEGVKMAEAVKDAEVDDIIKYVYEEPTKNQTEQLEKLKELLKNET